MNRNVGFERLSLFHGMLYMLTRGLNGRRMVEISESMTFSFLNDDLKNKFNLSTENRLAVVF